jgi:hypothetical protein
MTGLFKQHHLSRLSHCIKSVIDIQFVDINAAAQIVRVEIHFVISRGLLLVYKHCNLLAKDVVDF